MISYGMKKYMLDRGFEEIKPWILYKHENGLEVFFDEHEWMVEDKDDDWTESGSLNDTNGLERIIEDYEVGSGG